MRIPGSKTFKATSRLKRRSAMVPINDKDTEDASRVALMPC